MQQDPAGVCVDLFGSDLWPDQQKILESVRDHPKTAWRSCHGIGKTYIAARLVLWWLYSFPYSIVLTTAPTWRQVEDLLWKEIRAAHAHSRIPLGGHLPQRATELQIDGKNWAAIGLSTNDPNRFQGYHSEHLLVVVDEAAGVAEDIFEAINGVLTSAHCRLILIGNPTDIGGQFYRAFRTEGWNTGSTAAWQTPNFTHYGITREDIISGEWQQKAKKKPNGDWDWPMPWLITPAWAANALQEWGEHHPAWSARVEGEFPEQGEYNVIPLSWIEQAQDRWPDTISTGSVILGVDVARGGMDKSAIAARQGKKILWVKTYSGLDTQQLAGEVLKEYRATNAMQVNVDVIGLGAGVVDELNLHSDINCREINVSSSSDVRDKDGNRVYQNLRAELWWSLRQALDPKGDELLALPKDGGLLGDLAAPRYSFAKGWIQIEDKEQTKKRLGRSPDEGDAVMLTYAPFKDATVLRLPTKPMVKQYRIERISW
ncbi:MAG: hypothetical protein A4E48_00234 [Methanosaeta sp. PtaU1.Bin060]|nr:MAG: hypothetical protein A4E48_00234 [Methanosaeta sp. PtaU1.Bin060]